MDRGARHIVNGGVGKGISMLLLLALLLVPAGCHWGGREGTPPPPVSGEVAGDNTASTAVTEWLPPAVATDGAGETTGALPAGDTTAAGGPEAVAPAVTTGGAVETTGALPTGDDTAAGGPEAAASGETPPPEVKAGSGVSSPHDAARSESAPPAHKPKPAAEALPVPTESPKIAHDAPPPAWAKSPEELVYRVDFIGITMGYARFRYDGKVFIEGKTAYHLNVRAWTSGVLSFIYPINDTIDYYLDAETLAPIRQEFTRPEREKDDVAIYDQETGKITYRYRQSGKIRKEVDTPPSVYDPVSLAYYFRWRDLGVENSPRNMYGGRKVYQISSRILGNERIRTERGEVDTIAVLPIIRRDGKPDNKGDLKIWFSTDERRVPVRMYAKFRKIREWTLVGELMPAAGKAGG